MIKVQKLSYSIPQKDLYKKISFTLEDGQHCAFIGSNGTGKSTLVDMIMHKEEYLYDGKIELAPHCRVGYISQFSTEVTNPSLTVLDYLSEQFVQAQEEIAAICVEMETAEDMEAAFEKYQKALDAFSAIGGDAYESNILKQLKLAGLENYRDNVITTLSSGEFKIIQVIRQMITEPNLLIMDEPDVYLDFAHINALMNLINAYKGTMLVVTHNRYLLNHCFNKILHLENADIQEFDGSYTDYRFNLLQTKMEMQELAAADLEEIERNEKVVEKLRAEATMYTDATRGRALHARVSLLERLKARRIKEPFVDISQPEIHFSTDLSQEMTATETESATIRDRIVLSLTDYSAAFDELLLSGVNFELKANEKVAIVGTNGTGKTTMLRQIFANQQESIKVTDGVEMAFLSQFPGETLSETNTIIEEFETVGFETEKEIAAFLSGYGFQEDELRKKIATFSGGEKNLLQLAKLAAGNANLLLLDEPTSHLDLYGQAALEKALNEYNGAILMVSHDFYTIADCMDAVLLVEGQTMRKMSIRKFRKMIYADHFDKDYLELEQKKKELEMRVEKVLIQKDFEQAQKISEELEAVIKKMQ